MTSGGVDYQDPVSSIRKVTVTHSGIARKPLSTAEAYTLHVEPHSLGQSQSVPSQTFLLSFAPQHHRAEVLDHRKT